MERFTEHNYQNFVQHLSNIDADLKCIFLEYGMPPLWVRPNNFATLVLTILEQQVSLQSAFAAYKKLTAAIGEPTPEKILAMPDETLRACSFTRQKMGYVRELATALYNRKFDVQQFETMPDDAVWHQLIQLNGIGHWTVDVYLLHALQRSDVFPIGDIALVHALRQVKRLDKTASKESMLQLAEPWRPYRSLASMMLWHFYLSRRKAKVALI